MVKSFAKIVRCNLLLICVYFILVFFVAPARIEADYKTVIDQSERCPFCQRIDGAHILRGQHSRFRYFCFVNDLLHVSIHGLPLL